jgi:hypothetical protein
MVQSRRRDSNPLPLDYETSARPIVLHRRGTKLRAEDSNLQPSVPETDVLPDCTSPQSSYRRVATGGRTRDLRHGETALYRIELQPRRPSGGRTRSSGVRVRWSNLPQPHGRQYKSVPGEIRTPDPRIRNPVLYPLSYEDVMVCGPGRIRTADPRSAEPVRYQLRYKPIVGPGRRRHELPAAGRKHGYVPSTVELSKSMREHGQQDSNPHLTVLEAVALPLSYTRRAKENRPVPNGRAADRR